MLIGLPFIPWLLKEVDMNNKGFTAVEMVIVLIIISVLAAVFYKQLSITYKTWNSKQRESQIIQEVRNAFLFMKNRLTLMDSSNIIGMSSDTSSQGYLMYKDVSGNIIGIFFNSSSNQAVFGTNSLPVDSLIYAFHDITTGVTRNEPILDEVSGFSVTTFESTGDLYPTSNIHDIGSIGLKLSKNRKNGEPVDMETLIYLRMDNFAAPGNISIGGLGINFDKDQDSNSIATDQYIDFSNSNELDNNWLISTQNDVVFSIDTAEKRLHMQQLTSGAIGKDQVKYKETLTDVTWYLSCDVSFLSTGAYQGNRMIFRMQDSSNSDNYFDFILDATAISLYNGTVKVNDWPLTLNLPSMKYYTLAFYRNKINGTIEAYFDLEKKPLAAINNWMTNAGIDVSIIHERTNPASLIEASIKNFIIAKTPIYNVEINSDSVTLKNPDQNATSSVIATDKLYGMYVSPVYKVNQNLPAHFNRFGIDQNVNSPRKTDIFVNVDNNGWSELSPSADVSFWSYDISNLIGSSIQYRVEIRSPDESPAAASISTINISW
ncbi:MAG TPA: hypothetical protein DF296_14065 [Candidatus Margulisbacteria bacterium]|nr:hypothetical protein [Candidatus Margulisiibacteriota bacterium]HCT86313.1 hypothetical protein [Candidatus Margulisiibacteriota bacterium]